MHSSTISSSIINPSDSLNKLNIETEHFTETRTHLLIVKYKGVNLVDILGDFTSDTTGSHYIELEKAHFTLFLQFMKYMCGDMHS